MSRWAMWLHPAGLLELACAPSAAFHCSHTAPPAMDREAEGARTSSQAGPPIRRGSDTEGAVDLPRDTSVRTREGEVRERMTEKPKSVARDVYPKPAHRFS